MKFLLLQARITKEHVLLKLEECSIITHVTKSLFLFVSE